MTPHAEDTPVETLIETLDGDVWWKQCRVKGCMWHVTHDSVDCCYIHSRWYRPYKRYFNLLVTFIEDLFEKAGKDYDH